LARGEPPRPEVRHDVDDAKLPVEEHDVDGEAHEHRVDRGARAEQEPLAGREPAAPEQPAEAREERVGDGAAVADRPSVGADECLRPTVRGRGKTARAACPRGCHARARGASKHASSSVEVEIRTYYPAAGQSGAPPGGPAAPSLPADRPRPPSGDPVGRL